VSDRQVRSLVTFSREVAASELWAFGEDALADVVLGFSDDQLASAWKLAATLNDADFPLPVVGRRITLGHVCCFACMVQVEGAPRQLARQRRRPEAALPARFRSASLPPPV
jgi:hypothetical protein